MSNEFITHAGAVLIEDIAVISSSGGLISLKDFLVELNLYEDIFSNFITGNIALTDSRNLVELLNLKGEEILLVKFKTPSFPTSISKAFRVYRISDRSIALDTSTQIFVMHFTSLEFIYDITLPLFLPFEGDIKNIVTNIFNNFISTEREYTAEEGSYLTGTNKSTISFIGETSNKVKFVSPGWLPSKCINWLATKAIPKDYVAKSFLFFETSQRFCFACVEALLKNIKQLSIGKYTVGASNIAVDSSNPDASSINREYFLAKNFKIIENVDNVKNISNGYLANRLITLDFHNKKYTVTDYDYVSEYKKQFHTTGENNKSIPVFSSNIMRNPAAKTSFYPVNPRLYDNTTENFSDVITAIHGNRRSSLLDIDNIKANLVVPGRTDVEVGTSLYLSYPVLGGGDRTNNGVTEDVIYSGYYLITAIHHTVTLKSHYMTMEIVKDSLGVL